MASNRDQVDLAGFVRYPPPLAGDWISSAALTAPGPISFNASAPEIQATSGATPVFLFAFSDDKPVAETIELASSMVPVPVKWNRRAVQPLTPAAATVSRTVDLGMTPEKPGVLLTNREEIPVEPAVIEEPVVAQQPALVAEMAAAPEPLVVEPLAVEPVVVEPVTVESIVAAPVVGETVFAEPASLARVALLAMPAMLENPRPVARPIPFEDSKIVVSQAAFRRQRDSRATDGADRSIAEIWRGYACVFAFQR
jgi:hypothetical protein